MNKKQLIGVVAVFLVVVGLIVFFVIRSRKHAEDLEASNKIEIVSNMELDDYVGYWFLSKDQMDDMYIHIKEVNFSDFSFDLFFNNTYLNNLTITINDGKGDLNYVDGESSLKGEWYLYDNQMVLSVSESTYPGLDIGNTYKFSYKQDDLMKVEDPIKKIEGPVISSSYVGTWYENNFTDFKTSLVIMGIDGNTLNMFLTIKDTGFKISKVDIIDNKGSFEAITRDEEASIKGELILGESTIILKINESSVESVANNYDYIFKLKLSRVNMNDYIGKWYMDEAMDTNNYVEIKKVSNGVVVFDWYYGNRAQITNVNATLKQNIASFECVGGDERVLGGNLIFENGKLYVSINNTTVDLVQKGTNLEFDYKGGS